MDTESVISAFLDDEAFDPADLARVLADATGRDLLLDLVALRALIREEPVATPVRPPRLSRSKWIAVGFLAASVLFGAGAAWLLPPLLRQRSAPGAAVPPTPTHVVTFETGVGAP